MRKLWPLTAALLLATCSLANAKVSGSVDLGGGASAKIYLDTAGSIPGNGSCRPKRVGGKFGRYHDVKVLDSLRQGAAFLRYLQIGKGRAAYWPTYICSTNLREPLRELYSSDLQFSVYPYNGSAKRLYGNDFRDLSFDSSKRYVAWVDSGCDTVHCWTDPYVMDLMSGLEQHVSSYEEASGGTVIRDGVFKVLGIDDCGDLTLRWKSSLDSGDPGATAPSVVTLPKLCAPS